MWFQSGNEILINIEELAYVWIQNSPDGVNPKMWWVNAYLRGSGKLVSGKETTEDFAIQEYAIIKDLVEKVG